MDKFKIYKPSEAVPLMGIRCTKATADVFIKNMYLDGQLKSSYKLGKRWVITAEDVINVREKIMTMKYKPNCFHKRISSC